MTSPAKKRPMLKEVTPEAQAAGEIEVGYSGIGADLRAARLRLGYELTEIAERLNIKCSNLEAIEQGRFSALPGPAYASGFLRSFAVFVGMDGELALKRFREEVEAPKPGPLIFPTPTPEGRMPSGRTILLALLAAGVVYSFWGNTNRNDQPRPLVVAEVPERLAPLAKTEAPPPLPPAPVPAEASNAAAVPAVEPAPTPEASPAPAPAPAPPPVLAERPAAPQPVAAEPALPVPAPVQASTPAPAPVVAAEAETETPPARLFGATNTDSRVLIVARMDSWIQVRGKDREMIFSRTLRAGDSFKAPNRLDLNLMTGNAGGLEIVVDGKPIPPVGAVGAVRRDISLDPEKLNRGERPD